MTSDIKTATFGPVLEIRFNRPAKKNAITNDMYGLMADALEAAAGDRAIRSILFTAEGDFYTAGNDLLDFAARAQTEISGASGAPLHVLRFLERLIAAEKPIVASVSGHAVGVGVTMLLHCDLVFVAEEARLTVPFVNLGLVPEAASSLLLPQRIGHARAFAMFTLGEALSGRDAESLSFANKALPQGEVEAAARAAAQAIAERPPGAVAITKRLMRDTPGILARMREEGALFEERLRSPEAAEAFAAFLERRSPNFSKLAAG